MSLSEECSWMILSRWSLSISWSITLNEVLDINAWFMALSLASIFWHCIDVGNAV